MAQDPIKSPYGNSPDSLKSVVPQPAGSEVDLGAELDKFKQSQAAGAVGQSAEADLGTALDQYRQQGQPPPPAAEPPGMLAQAGGKVLDAAGRVLDYGSGAVRTLAAAGLGVANDADAEAAMRGKAPSSAEYLRRLGVSDGMSFTVPGTNFKVTQRGAEGLALDIASGSVTKELKAIGSLVKEVPYIGKLINVPGAASEALGEATYKAALRKVDKKIAEEGGDSLGQALAQGTTAESAQAAKLGVNVPGQAGGKIGGAQSIKDNVQSMSDTLGKLRKGLYDKATEKGISIDTKAMPLSNAEAVLTKLYENPTMRPMVDELRTYMQAYKDEGKVALETMSDWKTSLASKLPKSAWITAENGNVKLLPEAMRFKQALASDFRNAIIKTGNAGEKGLGDAVEAVNNKWGILLDGQRLGLNKLTNAGEIPPTIGHAINLTLAATGHYAQAALTKAADLATTPYAKTLIGKTLMTAGKSGLADALANRSIVAGSRGGFGSLAAGVLAPPGAAQQRELYQPPPPEPAPPTEGE